MERIASFQVDHEKLLRGIYVSRRDAVGNDAIVTTFDIRMTEPNRQQPLNPAALHAMEHIAATFLRNHPIWGNEIVYWGPMGCCTGNYLLVKGNREPDDILDLMKETMLFIETFEGDIPGASPKECGNYSFMNREGARKAAADFRREVLDKMTPDNMNYPQ